MKRVTTEEEVLSLPLPPPVNGIRQQRSTSLFREKNKPLLPGSQEFRQIDNGLQEKKHVDVKVCATCMS